MPPKKPLVKRVRLLNPLYEGGYNQRAALDKAAKLAAALPEENIRLSVLSIIRLLTARDPPPPLPDRTTIFSAEECFHVPPGYDPIALVYADIFSEQNKRLRSIQLHPADGSIESDDLTGDHIVSSTIRSSRRGESRGFTSLPMATDINATPDGLGQFPLQLPSEFANMPPWMLRGRDATPTHCTELGVTLGIAGSVTNPHTDYFGAHNLVVTVKGLKIWLFWPPSAFNIDKAQAHFVRQERFDVDWAIVHLQDLSVIVTDHPVALVMPPLQLHAVITLETSIHVGGPIWSMRSMPSALERMEWVLSRITHALQHGKKRTHFCDILAFARHTIPNFDGIFQDFGDALQGEDQPEVQKTHEVCAELLARVKERIAVLEERSAGDSSDDDE